MQKSILNRMLRRHIRQGYRILLALFVIGFIWMVFAPLDSAFAVSGILKVKGNAIEVDHPYGGIIEKIAIDENSRVNKYDLLMKLDANSAHIDRDLYKNQLDFLEAEDERINAEKNDYKFDDNKLKTNLAFQIEYENFKLNKEHLELTQNKISAEINGLKESLSRQNLKKKFLEEKIKLKKEEVDIFAELTPKGLAKLTEKILISNQLQELEYEKQQVDKEITQLTKSVESKKQELKNAQLEDQNRIFDEESKNIKDKKELIEKLKLAHDIVNKSVIYTETDGYISALNYYTVGSYIPPNEKIFEITPLTSDVLLEVKIPNENIIHVHKGKKVSVQLSGFKMDLMPRISGEITYVAANSTSQKNPLGGMDDVYIAYIKLNEEELLNLSIEVYLKAGMPATAFITMGENSVYNAIKTRLKDITAHAFKEG